MNIYKFLYPKNSLKRKILEIKDEMKILVSRKYKEKVKIDFYGAFDIDPKNLVFWICIKTDLTKEKLKSDKILQQQLRSFLDDYNYPNKARESVFIGFESQETVDRESDGNWYQHYK